MRVESVPEPGTEWDQFAESVAGATLGHAAAWASTLRRAYRLDPCYLAARAADGEICGVLPLVRFRSLSGRRSLVSIPFHDSAGILARGPEAERALLDAALEQARHENVSALELRQSSTLEAVDAPESAPRVGLVMGLEASEEAQWKAFRAKVRNQTRKAEREGLKPAQGRSEELLDAFYRPFTVNMRDLGSPVHARSFYASMADAFGERLRFVVALRGDRSVGGLVAIRYAGKVTVTWASTLRSERQRCPNNLIYWEAIRWAIEVGASHFDFGRSPRDGGTYRFKRGWGAEEVSLPWQRLAPGGSNLDSASGSAGAADGALLQRLSQLWTRLPLGLTTALGPRVRRYLAN